MNQVSIRKGRRKEVEEEEGVEQEMKAFVRLLTKTMRSFGSLIRSHRALPNFDRSVTDWYHYFSRLLIGHKNRL